MKKLSKDEMKKIVGGDPPQVWCYACDYGWGQSQCYPSVVALNPWCGEGGGTIILVRCSECAA